VAGAAAALNDGESIGMHEITREVGQAAPDTRLREYRFDRYVLDVAIATLEHGGVTARLDTGEFLRAADMWGFPKYPSRTAILPPASDLVGALKAFIRHNEPLLLEPKCWLGTWINPTNGCCYLDITTSCADLDEARRVAQELSARDGRKIVALYNAGRNQTIYLWDDVRA
jgi:hypothetical protein